MNRIYIIFAGVFVISSTLTLLSGINYGLYLIFLFLAICGLKKKKLIPLRYVRLLLLFVLVIAINAFISPYTPSLPYVILGTFIVCLPFFHYIISSNFRFRKEDIYRLIKIFIYSSSIVCFVIIAESIINPQLGDMGLLNSKFFRIGFAASFCNQTIALSLFLFKQTKNKKYKNFALFFVLFVVSTLQLKAIFGSMLVIVGYYYYTHSHRGIYVKLSLLSAVLLVILFSIPSLNDKIENYIEMYTSEGATKGIARNALYYTAGRISIDYFPFGTGQGTYASIPSKLLPDRVFSEYGIDRVYGLDGKEISDFDFRLDTHWANILGENGVLGLILYLILFFYPLREVIHLHKKLCMPSEYRFVLVVPIISLFIESFALPLPGRLSFIFIYSGLSAIILQYLHSYINAEKGLMVKDNNTR